MTQFETDPVHGPFLLWVSTQSAQPGDKSTFALFSCYAWRLNLPVELVRVQQPQVGVAFARLKVLGRVVVGREPVARKEQQDAQPTDRTYSDQIDATRHGFLLPRFAAGGHYFLHKKQPARIFWNTHLTIHGWAALLFGRYSSSQIS